MSAGKNGDGTEEEKEEVEKEDGRGLGGEEGVRR